MMMMSYFMYVLVYLLLIPVFSLSQVLQSQHYMQFVYIIVLSLFKF